MKIVPTWLLPACLSFGSLFMVIGQSGRALTGALMLSAGLATLFVRVMHLEREVEALRSQPRG